jgi:hypothetical protein
MKKIFKVLVALILVSGLAHAEEEFAIGVLVDVGNGNNDVDVTVKYNTWKFDIGDNRLAADKLFVEADLIGDIQWFLGLGVYSNLDFDAFGARIPVGLNYDLGSSFDIFVQYVFNYSIEPSSGNTGENTSVGLRYYF